MIIGSRGSALALAQVETVRSLLRKNGIETELKIIKTSGDVFTNRPLHEIGVGIFVREIDELMLKGEIDAAVHSMKDIPTERPAELSIGAVLHRDSPYDVLISDYGFDDLPCGAVIGTSSMRRRAQLLRLRPDLDIRGMRGNIDTRLRKLREGKYDGIVLAEAGLERLKLDIGAERLIITPSANQGTIAVVVKKGTDVERQVKLLDCGRSRIETEIERTILGILGGGCVAPIGILARFDDEIVVRAEVLSPGGERCISVERSTEVSNYKSAAVEIGNDLKNKGGAELIEEANKRIRG
ncbi:MAG: hydroxymethylbilane synthase [Methanosarcinales archaeon Met12]|nr:MAG: hydroxymethylbilane synthase [Methanosarcinales archaeon Met12]